MQFRVKQRKKVMKTTSTVILASVAMALMTCMSASAVMITADDFVYPVGQSWAGFDTMAGDCYIEADYKFRANVKWNGGIRNGIDNTPSLYVTTGSILYMEHKNGDLFTLKTMDILNHNSGTHTVSVWKDYQLPTAQLVTTLPFETLEIKRAVDLNISGASRVAFVTAGSGGSFVAFDNIEAIPEPGSMAMMGLALAGIWQVRRWRARVTPKRF